MDSRPIGVFDSGVGGLTVARAIMDQLPSESITYIGDTAHTPYGPLPLAKVREYALDIMDALVAHGVKMLVIACNTATAAVLAEAQERYDGELGIPVLGVIDPAVRRAVSATTSGRIGVIGTQATINSRAYPAAFEKYPEAYEAYPDLEITSVACPAFVQLVEHGITAGPHVQRVASGYFGPLLEAEVDTLVLGCTHYPLLQGAIGYVMGEHVTLVSSADETARDVYRQLAEHDMFSHQTEPVREFYATGDPGSFGPLARRFIGPDVGYARSTKELDQ
ncbi:MAG: glutamate racemase [Ancrocorticia sp.]|uniref:glutamate racemase n=1 Tax=Ancrocorticia sp. TaxID=2593684 RepID=UPI003F8EC69A